MPVDLRRTGLQNFNVKMPNKGYFRMNSPHSIPNEGWSNEGGESGSGGFQNIRMTHEGIEKVGGMESIHKIALDNPIIMLDEFVLETGGRTLLAGTKTNIYKYAFPATAGDNGLFSKILPQSPVVTMTTPADGVYQTDAIFDLETEEDKWFLTNGVDNIKVWNGSGSLIDLGGSPPKAYQITNLGGHVILGDVTESGTRYRNKIVWSDAEDVADWSTGSSGEIILDTPDPIIAMRRMRDFVVIYTGSLVYILRSISKSPYFQPVAMTANVQLLSSRAIADVSSPLGSGHLLMAEDNVYLFDGVNMQAVGDPVHRAIYRETNTKYKDKVYGFFSPLRQETIFGMTQGSGTSTDTDIAFIHHVRLNAWGQRQLEASCGVVAEQQKEKAWADFTSPLATYGISWTDVGNNEGGKNTYVGANNPVPYTTGNASQAAIENAEKHYTVTGSGTEWTEEMVGRAFIFADGTSAGTIAGVTSKTSMTVTNAVTYTTGTASQEGTTVTGSGTTWTSAMVGGNFIFADGTSGGTIVSRASNTSIVVTESHEEVSSQAYTITQIVASQGYTISAYLVSELDTVGTFNEQEYTAVATTKYYDMGQPKTIKRLAGIQIDADKQEGVTLDVSVWAKEKLNGKAEEYPRSGGEATPIQWKLDDDGETFIDLDITGRFFAFKFRTTGANALFRIFGFTVYYELREVYGEDAG